MKMANKRIPFRNRPLLVLIQLFVVSGLLLLFYMFFLQNATGLRNEVPTSNNTTRFLPSVNLKFHDAKSKDPDDYNIWLILTRVRNDSPLKYKFSNIVTNLLSLSSVPLKFHVIIDESSHALALNELSRISNSTKREVKCSFYNMSEVTMKINDIVSIMSPHFSSKPGTYYSDALFYISLGLHRIAPDHQELAVMLDCDLYFKDDPLVLFREFSKFKATALFGLAPELTPVYRHILHGYKTKHRTTFGEYYHETDSFLGSNQTNHPRGFQGYNSGVVLLNLTRIRQSEAYKKLLNKEKVGTLIKKYSFKGHLGDQDFYTLIGFEQPNLIQTLNCGFNRQLCTWWRDHGYRDVFDDYFRCKHKIVVLHGNCNTKIPK